MSGFRTIWFSVGVVFSRFSLHIIFILKIYDQSKWLYVNCQSIFMKCLHHLTGKLLQWDVIRLAVGKKKTKIEGCVIYEEKWNQTKYQKNSVMQNLHLNRNVCAMHNTKRRNMCGFVISKNASIYQNNQTEMSLIPCTCWASSHFVIGSLAFASLVL